MDSEFSIVLVVVWLTVLVMFLLGLVFTVFLFIRTNIALAKLRPVKKHYTYYAEDPDAEDPEDDYLSPPKEWIAYTLSRPDATEKERAEAMFYLSMKTYGKDHG